MDTIYQTADNLMKQGIQMKDAAHLACAIKAECACFITTDDKLIKKYTGNIIKIRNPLEFLNELEVRTDA
ncbi:MAG: hypothetical protein LBC99_10005 [Spirochaetota bacterium]|nr:hypothetical protein [Spirochaetota bacterium]